MSKLIWKQTYDIGLEVIDSQHRILVELINDLYEANSTGAAGQVVEDVFMKLSDYTHYHFSSEEDMLKLYGYPKLEEHIAEHEGFRLTIKKLKSETKGGNIILSLKTIDYLKDWTINHILGTDREFGEFVRHRETND
ncbi:MAG: hemerythrin family protein [Ignavibacteriales bacterium]|nr:hemerythrin family protein [Ignavibacteriales bacterium]